MSFTTGDLHKMKDTKFRPKIFCNAPCPISWSSVKGGKAKWESEHSTTLKLVILQHATKHNCTNLNRK